MYEWLQQIRDTNVRSSLRTCWDVLQTIKQISTSNEKIVVKLSDQYTALLKRYRQLDSELRDLQETVSLRDTSVPLPGEGGAGSTGMLLPDEVFDTLVEERGKYGAIPTDVELGQMLNSTAWAHAGTGWGLSRKTGGTVVPFPGGGTIAHDILHKMPENLIWDVFIAAGAASTPIQAMDIGVQTDPSRPFVAPVVPTY